MKELTVLSVFDGMSCGQIALTELGYKVKYYASEIKKHAIQCTLDNFQDTIQLGDIRNIKAVNLPKIDLFIGGSPCQDFSSQNRNRTGLQGLKSNLFFEYLRLWNEIKAINPKAKYLLENVIMLPEHFAALSNYMESYPVEINASLVSAANRRRLYWTNIGPYYYDLFGFYHCDIPQPNDLKITLQSVLTDGFTDRIKSNAIKTANGFTISNDLEKNKSFVKRRYFDSGFDNIVFNSPDFDISNGFRFYNKIELERLHNIPENYTRNLTVKKAHDLIGDGWNVNVIKHIFSFLK